MIKKYLIFLTLIFSVYSCTIISEKAAQKADKENAYLSTFLNKTSANLNSTLGKPTQVSSEGNLTVHIYEVKGTLFNCQRKFTIDEAINTYKVVDQNEGLIDTAFALRIYIGTA